MTTRVVHCRDPHDIYIGRSKNKFTFGNPFGTKQDSLALVIVRTRREAIESFKDWLLGVRYQDIAQEQRFWIINNLHSLEGKSLGCWCSPKFPCHGDVFVELLNSLHTNMCDNEVDMDQGHLV